MDTTEWERASVVRVLPTVAPRKLAKVPFVEMADGRLQGVVSSGSDIARVYVSSVTAQTHGLSCSTNNNRPCGGLNGGWQCKHIDALITEAVLQYGVARVAGFLRVEATTARELAAAVHGTREPAPAAAVFSRFLRHLAYLELPGSSAPLPEMQWFPATGVQR
ncbi:hypothetical protein ACWDYH_12645 [Nocardia goodfellowii]|uniref:SWIM-type domain-containing protein n=1 Tax=Nocardia goodfellowii TaxID=882446 RepID=A0ABS4QM88_9NOCA|nr:hypothetical protein [Nocardia goodfellowii]MBP2192816.1 hypothetical protein [Nocardia goodfellowii]